MTKKSDCTFVIVATYDNCDPQTWGPYTKHAAAERDLKALQPVFMRHKHLISASVRQCARPFAWIND